MIAGDLSHLFESAILDIIDPGGKVFDDIARHLLQLLPNPLAQLHPINHIVLMIHLSGEYVYQGLRAHSGNADSDSAGRDRNRDKEEEIQVILLSAPFLMLKPVGKPDGESMA